jgi:Uma2 family endonuclease
MSTDRATTATEYPRDWDRQLTEADFLDPQLGDQFMQGQRHYEDVEKVRSIIRHLHRENPHTLVTTDVKLVIGIAGLPGPAPDVAVIPHVQDITRPRTTFHVLEEGTRPTFILEMVSPNYRRPDREEKVHIYEQAGITEYFLIDANEKANGQVRYEIIGYRLTRDQYRPIVPDERGWVYSGSNHCWFAPTENKDGFFVVDGETDQIILTDRERAQLAEEKLAEALAELDRLKSA